jgi:hypothetical protein
LRATSFMRLPMLALVMLGIACRPTGGTATTRVGAVCHERKNCDSVCWEGTCTIACQTSADCPTELAPMICIEGDVCVFACARQSECGGWECIGRRRRESDERVSVCIPRFGGDNPEDIDPDPPDNEEPTPSM